MKREIFVFMDSVTQNMGEPFTLTNIAELKREFQKIVENPSIPAYAVRDILVIHLGTLHIDPVDPRIEPVAVPYTCLRGDSYNVEEIRRQNASCSLPASELPTV